MTAPLTPALALAYLGELSVDVRAAVVLDAAGEPLAGDVGLAARARELSAPASGADAPDPGVRRSVAADGTLLVARAPDGGAIAVLAGPCALLSLLGHDLANVAGTVATAGPPVT
jgi:hypothetical protein